jgi:hypothetical protein
LQIGIDQGRTHSQLVVKENINERPNDLADVLNRCPFSGAWPKSASGSQISDLV